jgi:hypothetical protein
VHLTARVEGDDTRAPVVLDEQIDREPTLAYLDVDRTDRVNEGTFDLRSRRVATGVHDPASE